MLYYYFKSYFYEILKPQQILPCQILHVNEFCQAPLSTNLYVNEEPEISIKIMVQSTAVYSGSSNLRVKDKFLIPPPL